MYAGIAHLIGIKRFVKLSLKLIRRVYGKGIRAKENIFEHVWKTMVNINEEVFFKIFPIISSMDISKIKVPILKIVGELEPKVALKHAENIRKTIKTHHLS